MLISQKRGLRIRGHTDLSSSVVKFANTFESSQTEYRYTTRVNAVDDAETSTPRLMKAPKLEAAPYGTLRRQGYKRRDGQVTIRRQALTPQGPRASSLSGEESDDRVSSRCMEKEARTPLCAFSSLRL